MLRLHTATSRRGFLAGSVSMGAFVLPQLGAHAGPTGDRDGPRARSVILLLQEGGMSHLESWDPKPQAPADVRGSFTSIPTTNPELIVGQHMPLLAQQAHQFNVVRSLYMDNARRDHSPGLHWVLTGYDNQAAGVALEKVNRAPSVGSVVAHQLGALTTDGLPRYATIPSSKQLGNRVRYTGALHLGSACEPFDSGTVPQQADGRYAVPTGLTLPADISPRRLQDRQRLLSSIDTLRRRGDSLATATGFTRFQGRAFDLLLGERGQQAFDLNQEPIAIREAYGDSRMGQGSLLARRLVEAGVTFVVVNYSKNNSWDTHANNFTRLKNTLLPPMDRAASALLVDLEQQGMLDEVLVVMMGEMGRTPKINRKSGRDHWPDVFSVMVAGGGFTRGQVLGSSSRLADVPSTRPVHYNELLATIYHQLGIDWRLTVKDAQQRPMRIMPEAEFVPELIA